jgi:nitrogen fixation negative regulator NifL
VLSVTAFVMVRNLETGKIQADFEQRARLMAESIKQSIDMSLDDAHSIVNLFSAAGEVDEGRFRLFVRPMLARHPTLLALLWVERVPDASREAYEAKLTARVRGFEISERGPDGQQVRAERRPEYFVVHYRESAAELDDSKVLGFDLGSGAAPREAIARSRDTGMLGATGRLATLASGGKEFGFAALVPLYRENRLPDTLEARRANLIGFGMAMFHINRLVETSLGQADLTNLDIQVLDQGAELSNRLLYFHSSRAGQAPEPAGQGGAAGRAAMHFATTIYVGGRQWELVISPAPGYLKAQRTHRPWDILGAGLLATAAVVAYLLTAARTSRIERLVAERTDELAMANEALSREADENRFQGAAFRAAASGIVIADRKGTIKWVNPAFSHMTGWAASEAIGQTPRILKSGEHDEPFYRALWSTILSGSIWRGEMVNRRKDGTPYTEEQTITPVVGEDGAITGFVAVKEDITEKRRLAEAARTREAYYRSLIENILDVILVVGADGFIQYASPSVKRVLGYEPEDRVGKSALEMVHPDDLPQVARIYASAAREANFLGSAEYRLRHRNGSWRLVEAVGKNLAEGEMSSGFVVTIRDITERREAGELQERLKSDLAQREKLAALGELLAGVAHELNNPLSVVVGYSGILMKATDPTVAVRAGKVNDAAERCARIVRNFLALARQHSPERDHVDVNAIAREVVEILAYQLRVDNVTVTLDLADDVPSLWADPYQLRQVLVNLITNAHHAVRETPSERRISVASRFEPGTSRVRLEISDSGAGISDEVIRRIFEPFFTTKPLGQGTGLGLPICRGIVESHGGVLEVEGRPGTGARFRAWLPLGVEVQGGQRLAAPAPRPGHGESILVVDDEPEVVALMAEILSNSGYRVDTAANGKVALEKIKEKAYDAVLSDVRMPVLDGPGLYREIKACQPRLVQQFAFLTGDTLNPDTARFLEETAVPCLSKPFRVEQTRGFLGQILAVDHVPGDERRAQNGQARSYRGPTHPSP